MCIASLFEKHPNVTYTRNQLKPRQRPRHRLSAPTSRHGLLQLPHLNNRGKLVAVQVVDGIAYALGAHRCLKLILPYAHTAMQQHIRGICKI